MLSISHDDMDGAVCSIILKEVFENITLISSSNKDIESYLRNVDFDKWDWVILTDIYPDKYLKELANENLIMLDHHKSNPYHNPKNKMFVKTDVSGALLTKMFFEKKFSLDLSHLSELVKFTNDYDLWQHKFKESKRLNIVFWKYYADRFIKRFSKGFDGFTKNEMIFIESQEKAFFDVLENLEVFVYPNTKIVLFMGDEFVNEICENLMYEEGFAVVFAYNTRNKRISLRGKNEKVDLGKIVTGFGWGGGHPNAAGMVECDSDEMRKRLDQVVDHLKENFSEFVSDS